MFDGAFRLDAYLARVGYEGPRTADVRTLTALAARHPAAIPFENLDPLLGRAVALDPDSLQRKLVQQERGGYCFEHNLLFGHALTALGFAVTGLSARVLWNVPPGTVRPRTHMLLRVHLGEEPMIVDAGFGGLTLTAPLRMQPDVEQQTPHGRMRLVRDGDGFVVEAFVGAAWRALYRFDLQAQTRADYEMANWFVSRHPASPFVTGLMAARPAPDRRYALRDNELVVHHSSGGMTRRRLSSAAELRTVLEGDFRIVVPPGEVMDAVLERLATGRDTAAPLGP